MRGVRNCSASWSRGKDLGSQLLFNSFLWVSLLSLFKSRCLALSPLWTMWCNRGWVLVFPCQLEFSFLGSAKSVSTCLYALSASKFYCWYLCFFPSPLPLVFVGMINKTLFPVFFVVLDSNFFQFSFLPQMCLFLLHKFICFDRCLHIFPALWRYLTYKVAYRLK